MRKVFCGLTLFVLLTTGCAWTYRAEIYPIPPDLKIDEFQGEGKAISIESEPIQGWVKIGKANLNGYHAEH